MTLELQDVPTKPDAPELGSGASLAAPLGWASSSRVRARVIPSVNQKNLRQCIDECVNKDSTLLTDEHKGYTPLGKPFKAHHTVVHSRKEYARREKDGTNVHVNSCESFFGLFKRAIVGSWHHVSREHLARYAGEFEFKWNSRKTTDGERAKRLVGMTGGKQLSYKPLTGR